MVLTYLDIYTYGKRERRRGRERKIEKDILEINKIILRKKFVILFLLVELNCGSQKEMSIFYSMEPMNITLFGMAFILAMFLSWGITFLFHVCSFKYNIQHLNIKSV